MWPMIIGAAVSLAQSAASASAARENAGLAEQTGYDNYNSIMSTGGANVQAIQDASRFNAALQLMGTEITADTIFNVSQYNANLRKTVGIYNAQLLQEEIELVWEAAGLDISQMEEQARRDSSKILASFGASGIQINETDSVLDVLVDTETQHQMNIDIVRAGAHIEAGKIRDAASRSVWEGFMEAQQISYEGYVNSSNARISGGISAIGTLGQGIINARVTYENALTDADSALRGGIVQGQTYRNQATTTMNSGIFSAAGSVAASYMGNATVTSSPSQSSSFRVGEVPETPQLRPISTTGQSVYQEQLLT